MRLTVRIVTVIAAFVLAMLLVLKFWVLPGIFETQNKARTLLLVKGVLQFQKDHGSFIETDNEGDELPSPERIAAILKGDNPSSKDYLDNFGEGEFKDGQILDLYGKPYKFQVDADGIVSVVSAGANGTFGDDDDVSDQEAQADSE